MRHKPQIFLVSFLVLAMFATGVATAHQPYIVDGVRVSVSQPGVSKAYYGKLDGAPHTYFFNADKPFVLYVNLLVPKTVGARTDFSFEVRRAARTEEEMKTIAQASGIGFNWQEYFEQFARDTYFKGPEYRADAPSGFYEIIVRNPGMSGRYAIAIGEDESFPILEMARLLVVLPRLKKEFFDTSPLYGFVNYIGLGLVVFLAVAVGLVLGVRRLIIRYFRKRSKPTIPEMLGKPPEAP